MGKKVLQLHPNANALQRLQQGSEQCLTRGKYLSNK